MAERSSYETNNIYPNLSPSLSNNQQFRLNRIDDIRDYSFAETKERKLMSKRLSKHIASFDYFHKSLIDLSVTNGSISIASFATVIGTPVWIGSESFTLAFSVSTGITKKPLKTTRNKKKKHNRIFMLARSKLNNIESKISEALTNNEIKHEDFTTIIDEGKKYREIKESIRMMNSKRSDAEKINLIEEAKKFTINQVIKRNKIIDNSLKP